MTKTQERRLAVLRELGRSGPLASPELASRLSMTGVQVWNALCHRWFETTTPRAASGRLYGLTPAGKAALAEVGPA